MSIFDVLIPDVPEPAVRRLVVGVVTSTSPLRVRWGKDPGPTGSTPITLVSPLAVGDHVAGLFHDSRVTVVGVLGGVPPYPVHRCEVALSKSSTPKWSLTAVGPSITSQTGGFGRTTWGVTVPVAGLWRASAKAVMSARPTSASDRNWIQLVAGGSVVSRIAAPMEEHLDSHAEFRVSAGAEVKVEWLPGRTASLTGNMILTHISD